jgi:hypothetical protein
MNARIPVLDHISKIMLIPRKLGDIAPKGSNLMNGHSIILAISILTCILVSTGTQSVSANEENQILITSNFPNDFTASLEYQSDIPVKDISFVFHVFGQEVERYYREPLNSATMIDINYRIRTDTTHRYIPPGSRVNYHFEITYEDGRTVRTSTKNFMYLDTEHTWRSKTSNNLSVIFYGNTDTRASEILETAIATTKSVGELFGMFSESPITIVIYESWKDMLPAIRFSSKTLQEELVTLGQAHPTSGIIMLIGGDKDVLPSTRHEIIHMLVYSRLKDSESIIPFWFNEGIAEFNNSTHVASYSHAISEAIRVSSLPSLEYFTDRPNTPQEIWLMYAVGSSFTEFLITSKGTNKMRLFLEGIAAGMPFNASFEKAYSLALIDAENEWRSNIGAPLINPSQPESSETEPQVPTPSTSLTEVVTTPRFFSCGGTTRTQGNVLPENMIIALAPAVLSLLRRRKPN